MEITSPQSLHDRKIAACIPAEWDAYVIYSVSKQAYFRADIAFHGKKVENFFAKREEQATLWAFNEASTLARLLHDSGEDAAILKATR